MESDFTVSRTNIETGGRSFGVAMHNNGLIYSKAQSSDYNKHTVFYDICFAKCMDSINFSPPTKLLGSMNKAFYEGAPSIQEMEVSCITQAILPKGSFIEKETERRSISRLVKTAQIF